MKILHIADTHLGYSAYRKVTEEGINQRETDIYTSFIKTIDYAINENIDLIIHAGDLFDTVRPNNRAITTALKEFLRLSKHNIPLILISGNHEQPKLKETGHIFQLFEHIPGIYPIYHEQYEKKILTIQEDTIAIHCLPQININDTFQQQLDEITKDEQTDYNIFVAHGSIQGIKEFSMNEFNEMILPKHYLSSMFDYIALGHYHKYTEINENTNYAGSTDTLTFSDANEPNGFIELTLESQQIKKEFKLIQTRPFIDTPTIECAGKSIENIMQEIIQIITKIEPKDKIFRITLQHIQPLQYRGLDYRAIREQSKGALHYEIQANIEEKDRLIQESHGKIESLTKEYTHYIKQQNIEDEDFLLTKGLQYIQKIDQKHEDL